jgi:hypothetical protein
MIEKKNPAFIVDVSETMVVSGINDNQNDLQKLFCSCGHSQEYSAKVKRKIVKNYDELTEDSLSIDSVVCNSCKTEYNEKNKAFLLIPNKDELYKIEFFDEQKGDSIILNKKKYFVNYSTNKDNLIFKEVIDSIEIDLKKEVSKINLNSPFEKDSLVSSFANQKVDNSTITKSDNFERVNKELDLTNIFVLDEFFNFLDSVEYKGLNQVFNFIEIIKPKIKDLDKFKNIEFLKFLEKNNEISEEVDSSGNVNYFQMIDSGFGDGKKVKKPFVPGDYIYNVVRVYKLFLSIYGFDNAANIITTKNLNFFNKWIESKYVSKPSVYKKHNASSPSQILEVSMIYNLEGVKREEYKDLESKNYDVENSGVLKISETIYNSISSIGNIETLISVYTKGILKKNEIETLLQKYETNRVYEVMNSVQNSTRRAEDIKVNYKHIEHILKYELDLEKKSDYITTYVDTIRVIGLLELKEKLIFKIRNYKELKELHDDYSARYNAMKDSRKAEFFAKAVEPFIKYNEVVGDIKFEVVPTTERLNLEGLQMHHCIYTYLDRICDKRYLAINVTHLITNERATAGFIRSGESLELEQLKGFYNSRATFEVIEATREFCRKNKFKLNSSTYDLMPDKSREKMMPGQISEEELHEIREKNKENSEEILESKTSESNEGGVNFFKKIFK